MPSIIILLLIIGILGFLIQPFLLTRPRVLGIDDPVSESRDKIRRARDRVYEEIRALQQERFLNHFTEQELQSQLTAARVQAAKLMEQQNQLQQTFAHIESSVDNELSLSETQDGDRL